MLKFPEIPFQYKILGIAVFLIAYAGLFYHFGSTAEDLECTDDKLDVAEEIISITNDNIVEHNEDAEVIAGENVIIEGARNETRTETAEVVEADVPDAPDVCGPAVLTVSGLLNQQSKSINTRLQTLYDRMPAD